MAKSNDSPQNQLVNLQAQQLAAQVANWAAQLEFQKERMRLLELPEMQGKLQVEIDKLAWQKAQDTWERAIKEATLTGTYNGQPTIDWLTQQAQLTGVLNGQQTIQGKLTDAQVAQMNQQMALANAQFLSNATGYINGQKTFDRQKFEATQASDAWKFLATLTGPANAFKQARAISSMPGGMQGIMQAWAGQYAPGGFGAVESGGQASLEGLLGGGGPGSPYYYPPQQPYGPTFMPPPYYGYPYGGTNPPYGPGPGPYPGSPQQPPDGSPAAPAPAPGVPAPGAPGAPAAPTTPTTPAAPGAASNAMDSGFYVWLRVHGYDPGGKDRDRLPEFIHNYMSLPAADHAEFTQVGQRNPGIYQFDTTNWLDAVGLGFQPLPPQVTANPQVPQITQAQFGEGATPPDAATQAQLLASQGGRQGYWVQRNGQWTFIDSTQAPPQAMPPTGGPPGDAGGPTGPLPDFGPNIPGRGFPIANWNPATAQAAAAWNRTHPGYVADGSARGYHALGVSYTPPTAGAPGQPIQAQPPLPTTPGLNLSAGQVAGLWFGEGAAAPDAATQATLKSAQGGQSGYWVQRNGQWTFIADDKVQQWQQGQPTEPIEERITDAGSLRGMPGVPTSTGPLMTTNAYSYQPSGVQAPTGQWNYSVNPSGSTSTYPPGVSSPWSTPDISSPYPMSPQTAYNLYQYGGTPDYVNPTYGSTWKNPTPEEQATQARANNAPQAGPFGPNPWTSANMPLPNQISPQAYNNSYAYQKELGWAGYEDAGWDKSLAQEAYEKSLPRFGGPKRGSYAF